MLKQLKILPMKEINGRALGTLIILQCALFTIASKVENNLYINSVQFMIDVIFALDLFAKIKTRKLTYWKKPINALDASIVIASLLGHFILPNSQTLTALRVLRLFRLFRILRLIPNFEQISNGISQAAKASRGVFLMLFVLLSFFSVLGFLLFKDSIPSHFSDPLLASYTVFSLFTVEGWNELPSLVTADSINYYLIRAYVISIIVFGSFFALSLANAIFIDEMVMDNNAELEGKVDKLTSQLEYQCTQIEELKQLLTQKLKS